MGAVGPAWRHPPDGQTAALPQPLRALFLGTCVCLRLSTLHPQGGEDGITGRPLRHSTLQSGPCVTGIIVLGLVTVHPVGLRKRTFIMLGLILSTVPMKLALPLGIHPAAAVTSAVS